MNLRLAASSSLLAIGLGACSASDDIWYPPGSEGGKADSFSTIKGSEIPSQYVSGSTSYLIARRIDSLKTVGALDTVEEPLVARIDGIIANMPADGTLHLAELVRMEDPAIFDSLFAAEKAALPRLWEKVEAPSSTDVVTGADVRLGVIDTASPPGPAVPPASLGISTLATELQTPATRLQNVYNADGKTSTVQLADLDNGVANPGAFTPAEVTAFGTIKAVFREKAVATADATLVVSPAPGSYTKNVTLGPIGLHIAGTTRVEEERTQYSSQLTARLSAIHSYKTTATLPADHSVLVISKDDSSEATFVAGDVPGLAGPYVVEVWDQGQRVFLTNALLAATAGGQTIDLTDKLDYTLMTSLSPLVHNTVSAAFSGSQAVAKFSYDKTTIAPMGTLDANVLQRVATPTVKIPVGRYSFPQQQATVLVYPNNVVWVQRGNQMFRLQPTSNNNGAPTMLYNASIGASFETTNNQFYMSPLNVALTASMRDI